MLNSVVKSVGKVAVSVLSKCFGHLFGYTWKYLLYPLTAASFCRDSSDLRNLLYSSELSNKKYRQFKYPIVQGNEIASIFTSTLGSASTIRATITSVHHVTIDNTVLLGEYFLLVY